MLFYMVMRLDKLLAHYGIGTRKEVKKYIKKGYVKVNSQIIKKDDFKVDIIHDAITFQDESIYYKPFVYLMLHKPAGCVCATKDNVHQTVIDLIEGYENYDLFPVGRLDKDTEGLVILTNDGDFAHKLLSPNRHHAKLYYAHINARITDEDIQAFHDGVVIDGYRCFPAHLSLIKNYDELSEVTIEIFEGKFHQIKRMFQALGKRVVYLKRIKIKSLKLDPCLKLGEYRELSDDELFDLKKNL